MAQGQRRSREDLFWTQQGRFFDFRHHPWYEKFDQVPKIHNYDIAEWLISLRLSLSLFLVHEDVFHEDLTTMLNSICPVSSTTKRICIQNVTFYLINLRIKIIGTF